MSRARELTAVGEGLALGCVLLHIDEVGGGKGELELDFRRAWRAWHYANRFPHIHAGPSHDDIVVHILQRNWARVQHHVAEWQGAWPFVPVLLQDWDPDDIADIIDEGVPAAAWAELAAAWLRSAPTDGSHTQ